MARGGWEKALENGMNLNQLFEELKDLRQRVSIPILLMGYFNPSINNLIQIHLIHPF
jgi:tryptophan synthase alpha subunit